MSFCSNLAGITAGRDLTFPIIVSQWACNTLPMGRPLQGRDELKLITGHYGQYQMAYTDAIDSDRNIFITLFVSHCCTTCSDNAQLLMVFYVTNSSHNLFSSIPVTAVKKLDSLEWCKWCTNHCKFLTIPYSLLITLLTLFLIYTFCSIIHVHEVLC